MVFNVVSAVVDSLLNHGECGRTVVLKAIN